MPEAPSQPASRADAAPWRLLLARTPQVSAPDGRVQPLAWRDAALLAWLALEGATPRARLAALLWPDSAVESARNSLRQRLFQLRKLCGTDLVDGSATLALAAGVQHDLDDSDGVLGEAEPEVGGEFVSWLEQQRTRRRGRVHGALRELSEMAERAGDWLDALAHAHELLALEPLSEDAHRRVMRLHYLAGDRAAALLAFDRCERVLKDEVGATPSAVTLALLATIEQAAAPAASAPAAVPASVLRPPRLVGRARELAALAQAWHGGQVVAVIGEAGLGKTRLLQEFVHGHAGAAADRSAFVHVAGRPGDAGVPFATLARLLRSIVALGDSAAQALLPAPTRSEIARVLPEFDHGAALRQAGEGQRLVLLRAVRALLAAHAQLGTLIVDDLHFVDDASLDLLGSLVDGSDEAQPVPWRWILACRPAETGSTAQALLDRLVEQVRLVPLPLQPLDAAALAELVDSLGLPGIDGAALAPGLLQRTGGNPLFVLETLKQAWVERTLAQLADARQMPRPLSVGRLIERRVAQLSPRALALARVAAIAGVDFGVALAEHVLCAPAIALADAVGELEAAQVMRGDAFAHDLVADAVRASVPATVAVHTHAQVAEWLEAHGGEPARIARHWIDARRDARALPWLQQAADLAQRAVRYREAVGFLDTKSAIEEALGQRAAAFESLQVAADRAFTLNCTLAAGEAYCDRLDRLAGTAEQTATAQLLRAGLHAQLRNSAATVEHGQRAFALAESIGHTRLMMHSHRVLSDGHSMAGQAEQAVRHALACIDWIDAHDDATARSWAHGGLAMELDNLGRGGEALPHHEAALALALQANDLQQASVVCVNTARNHIWAGRIDEADGALAKGRQWLVSCDGEGSQAPALLMALALTQCTLGRFASGLELAQQALQAARDGQPGWTALAGVRLASCWWQLGQWARMKQALDAVPPGAGPAAVSVGRARMTLAYARAMQPSDVAAQRQALRQVLDAMAEGERPDLRLPTVLALADGSDPAHELPRIEHARRTAEAIGYRNVVLAAYLREADVAAAFDPPRARRAALAALQMHAQGVQTTALLPAELWLHAARALASAGDRAHATEVAGEGCVWIEAAVQQVPEPFCDGFVQRHPVHRELLALHARLAAGA